MSVQVEKLEKSMAKLTITVEAAKFDAAVDSAYQKNKGKIALPGFRKGKAPRAMIEKMYGTGVFFEDAANELIPEAYETAAKESELEIVAQPEIRSLIHLCYFNFRLCNDLKLTFLSCCLICFRDQLIGCILKKYSRTVHFLDHCSAGIP